MLVILCQRSLAYLWLSNNFTIVAGSNQGGNNLTLKGWPLTVSLSWCALCIAGFLYCKISEFMFALNNLDRPMTYERKLFFMIRGNCYLQMYACDFVVIVVVCVDSLNPVLVTYFNFAFFRVLISSVLEFYSNRSHLCSLHNPLLNCSY